MWLQLSSIKLKEKLKNQYLSFSNISHVKCPTATSTTPETYLYLHNWVMLTFPNIGFIASSSNLNYLHEQLNYHDHYLSLLYTCEVPNYHIYKAQTSTSLHLLLIWIMKCTYAQHANFFCWAWLRFFNSLEI